MTDTRIALSPDECMDILLYGTCFRRLSPDGSVTHVPAQSAEAEEAMEIIRDRVLKRRAVLHPQEKPE